MLLSEYYKDSKYSQNGENYEIIEYGDNQRSHFTLRCVVCGDVNSVAASSILSGRKPCLCSGKAYNSPEKMFNRVLDVIKNKPIKLLQDSISGSKSPLRVECLSCGKVWDASYNSIALKGAGCGVCNKSEKLPEEIIYQRIAEFTNAANFSLKGFDYKPTGSTSKLKVSLICNICQNDWVTSYASLSAGRGCPACAKYGFQKNKPASLYVLKVVSEDGILMGYKYGITCDLKRRLQQHNKLCKFLGVSFDLSFVWNYTNGLDASQHEKVLKDTFQPYFQKHELPSGFTETVGICQLGELLDIQNSQYRKLKWQILE